MTALLSLPGQWYRRTKMWINYLLDRVIELADFVLMDGVRLPWPAAQTMLQRLARVVGDASWLLQSFPRLPAYKLTGSGWRVVFVGREQSLQQVRRLFFDPPADPQPLERVALWELSARARGWLREGAALVVCELSRRHPGRPRAALTFTALPWVQQILTLPAVLANLTAGSDRRGMRNKINRAQKAGFTYRFSQATPDFDLFYQRMYVPFVKARHDELALVTPYPKLKRWLTSGGLVLVCRDDTPVAGAICHLANHTYYSLEGGLWEAEASLFQQGLHSFNTWCELLYAQSRGVKFFDMGGSRAWRSDGPFAHKRGWGARVARRKRIYGEWTFLADDLPPALRERLNRLGFITERDGKFLGVVVCPGPATVTGPEARDLRAAAQAEGLEGVIVVTANTEPRVVL